MSTVGGGNWIYMSAGYWTEAALYTDIHLHAITPAYMYTIPSQVKAH